MVSSDVVYTLNVSPDAIQLGGETRGWDAVNAMMLGIREVFDYSVYRPVMLGADGDAVRFSIELVFRHKPSGELLSGNMRCVVTVKDGLVVRVDEFVDAPMVEAFMRLFASRGPDAVQA